MSGRKIILGINDDTTLHGGDGDDHFIAWGDFNKAKQTFVNDPKRDVKFYGNGGNDKLVGAGGNDFLDGGSGDDIILGYDGNDKIITGSGEDFVNAGNGDDEIIVNGAGLKHLYGGKGSDKFILNYMNLDSGIIINDFDLNDPNEVIDLRAIKSLHSIKDFHQVFHHDMPLQHSSDPDLYRTDSRPEGLPLVFPHIFRRAVFSLKFPIDIFQYFIHIYGFFRSFKSILTKKVDMLPSYW